MRKHSRFFAVLLTSFFLVGITAAAAVAAISNITISPSTPITLTTAGQTATITVTASGATTTTASGNSAGNQWKMETSDGNVATVDKTSAQTSATATEVTITAVANGTATITATSIKTGTGTAKTATVTVTVNIPEEGGGEEIEVVDPVLGGTPKALTWGSKWNNGDGFTPTDSARGTGSEAPAENGWSLGEGDAAVLEAAGLAFNANTGTINTIDGGETPTLGGAWTPNMDTLAVAINGEGSTWHYGDSALKYTIHITKTNVSGGSATQPYELTFNGVVLKALPITGSSIPQKNEDFKYGVSRGIEDGDLPAVELFKAYGPGTITWDEEAINAALPKGLIFVPGETADFASVASVKGKPELTYNNFAVPFKFTNYDQESNSAKWVTQNISFTIKTDGNVTISVVQPAGETPEEQVDGTVESLLPKEDVNVGDYYDGNTETERELVLKAVPGPIVWSGYDNLTATGLTVTTSGDEYLVISGKYKTARADKKDDTTKYTIKAANKYQKDKTQSVTQNVMVWTLPTFDQSYIFHNTADKKDKDVKIWKADFFKTNTELKQAIPVSNLPEPESWDVILADATSEITALSWTSESGGGDNGDDEAQQDDEPAADATKLYITDKSGGVSKSYLTAQVIDDVLYIIGSTDRVPSGGKLTVKVKARNHAGTTDEKTYTVTVIGTTPTLAKKNDMTLNGYGNGNSADIAITAGDPTITMTAKIEAKTAKKIFGIEKDIDLLADGPKYGIYVSGDMANGKLKIFLPDSHDNGPAETEEFIESLLGENEHVYKGYAFKKLPIVITAKNPDITYDAKGKAITDKKIATQKATLSTGNMNVAPYWVAPEAEELYKYGLSTALVSQDLGKKQVIYVPQKKPLANDELFPNVEGYNPYYFDLVGHGPFDVVVKPTEKNGIKAAVTDADWTDDEGNEYSRKRVTFTGTPSDTTKDVATAFSLTAKNPSTGKAAKLSVNFTAVPTPKVQEAKIGNSKEKPATVGKKVKVAPKITSNSKKIGWKIDSVEWNDYAPESGSGSVSQDLYDIWGLALDSKGKGSIEGTAKAATGTTTPLTVTMHAYTKASDESEKELTTSDPVTATIYIAGEKPKLGTKKVTVTIAEDDTYNFDESVFEIKKLNNASAPTEDNPVITALGENENKNHYVADMKPTDTFSATAQAENTIAGNFDSDTKVVAAKGLSIVRAYSDLTATDSKYNTFKLDGTPAGATKKETVQIAMNNWGTIQTDKLTVTIVGQTPVVEASTESLTDLPETSSSAQKITFTVSNADKVGSKIKWKITSKPASGVKAKLITDKSKPTQATVEITTKKATAGAETAVKVSATDSDTKKAGEKEVKLTVKAAPENPENQDTPTVVDDTAKVEETQTNEKALGEGEVHFGRERTAAGLTAAQRKFLADNGYVIAAVLPEIEVTEAGGQYALEVDELEEAAATGAELVYFAFSNKPTDDDEIVTFADLETGEETTVLPASRKLIVEPWFNVGTKYAPVIAVKAAAGEAEAATEEDVKAKAEEKAEEAAAEGTEAAPEVELKEVKDKDAE